MKILYRVTRTDINKELCWGDNLDMVVCADSLDMLRELIKNNILTDGSTVKKNLRDEPLTMDDIKIERIGNAEPYISLGVILMTNAGA